MRVNVIENKNFYSNKQQAFGSKLNEKLVRENVKTGIKKCLKDMTPQEKDLFYESLAVSSRAIDSLESASKKLYDKIMLAKQKNKNISK